MAFRFGQITPTYPDDPSYDPEQTFWQRQPGEQWDDRFDYIGNAGAASNNIGGTVEAKRRLGKYLYGLQGQAELGNYAMGLTPGMAGAASGKFGDALSMADAGTLPKEDFVTLFGKIKANAEAAKASGQGENYLKYLEDGGVWNNLSDLASRSFGGAGARFVLGEINRARSALGSAGLGTRWGDAINQTGLRDIGRGMAPTWQYNPAQSGASAPVTPPPPPLPPNPGAISQGGGAPPASGFSPYDGGVLGSMGSMAGTPPTTARDGEIVAAFQQHTGRAPTPSEVHEWRDRLATKSDALQDLAGSSVAQAYRRTGVPAPLVAGPNDVEGMRALWDYMGGSNQPFDEWMANYARNRARYGGG